MSSVNDPSKNLPPGYLPPRVWTWEAPSGGTFAPINRPISGATHEKPLPRGKHPLQLYSLGTPNGVKITILLEELLALGHSGAEYDAWLIRINDGDQFGSGFVAVNPNSKIPAMLDCSTDPPIRLFESGSILFYLAEKFDAFLPKRQPQRAATMNWLFWQVGSAPFLGTSFGHFYFYAPIKIEYAINRYAMEAKRLLHVLDTHLASHEYLAGNEYTIADIANWAWYRRMMEGAYNGGEFLSVHEYTHVQRWVDLIGSRPAVLRGKRVNTTTGPEELRVPERHSAADLER
jgi:GST-like protein